MGNKVIKIHGCSGAGKTTAVRKFMDLVNFIEDILVPGKDKIEGYRCTESSIPRDIYILGSYGNTCGGVDTISSAGEVIKLLEKYTHHGHIIFEGLLQSTYYGALGNHSANWPRNDYIYAFMDTPIDLCLERVVERRKASGRNNKFDPQLTIDKWETINRLRDKLIAGGKHRVVDIDHRFNVGEQIRDLMV